MKGVSTRGVGLALVVLLLASAGAGCASLQRRVAMAELDADNAVGALSLWNLGSSLKRAYGWLDVLRRDDAWMLGRIGSPERVRNTIGIDPRDGAAWRRIGIDPEVGFTLAYDRRLTKRFGPRGLRPFLLMRIDDEERLFRHLGAHSRQPVLATPRGFGVREVLVARRRLLVGRIRGFTLVTEIFDELDGDDLAITVHQVAEILREPSKTLAQHPDFPMLVGDLRSDAELLLWLNLEARLPGAGAPIGETYLGKGLRWLMVGSPVSGAMLRLTMRQMARKNLTRLFDNRDPPPNFTAYVPRADMFTGQVGLDLKDLPGKARDLIDVFGADSPIGAVARRVAGAAGPLLEQATTALSGHVAFVREAPSGAPGAAAPHGVIMLGVRDPTEADRMLVGWAATLRDGGVPVTEGRVGRWIVYRLALPGAQPWYVARDGRVLLASQSRALALAALRKGRASRGAGGPRARPGQILKVGVDFGAIAVGAPAQRLAKRLGPGVAKSQQAALKRRGRHPSWLNLWLDHRGAALMLESSTPEGDLDVAGQLATWIGALSMIETNREERMRESGHIGSAFVEAALRYYQTPRLDPKTGKRLPCRFPPSTPLTPKDRCCVPALNTEGDGRCKQDARRWQHEGWQALGGQPAFPLAYRYRFESEGVGSKARFTLTILGDLDCDGVLSTFRVEGRGDPQADIGRCTELPRVVVTRERPGE